MCRQHLFQLHRQGVNFGMTSSSNDVIKMFASNGIIGKHLKLNAILKKKNTRNCTQQDQNRGYFMVQQKCIS